MGAFLSFVRHIYAFYGVGNMHASNTSQALAATNTSNYSMPTNFSDHSISSIGDPCGKICHITYMDCMTDAGLDNAAIQTCFNTMTTCYWDDCKSGPPSYGGPFDVCVRNSQDLLLECYRGDQNATLEEYPECKDQWLTNFLDCAKYKPEHLSSDNSTEKVERRLQNGFLMLFCDDQT